MSTEVNKTLLELIKSINGSLNITKSTSGKEEELADIVYRIANYEYDMLIGRYHNKEKQSVNISSENRKKERENAARKYYREEIKPKIDRLCDNGNFDIFLKNNNTDEAGKQYRKLINDICDRTSYDWRDTNIGILRDYMESNIMSKRDLDTIYEILNDFHNNIVKPFVDNQNNNKIKG